MSNKRDLGKLGENTLRKWASEEGIVINSSDENDKTGWDFLLEFPFSDKPEISEELSADQLPQELACFVQVKSTDSKNKSISVSLEHWKRQIERPNPVFFLVMEFDNTNDVQRAFLVEVDKNFAEKALKRLRKVSEKKLNSIHKMKMSFKYTDSHKLYKLSGKALAESIRKVCGSDLKAYCNNKLEWQTKLGYEDRPVKVQITFKEEDEIQRFRQLVAFSIGEIDELPASSLEIGYSRFGITKKSKTSNSDITLKVPKLPSTSLVITLKDDLEMKKISLVAAGLFPGALFPFIPQKYWRVKIKSKFIEIQRDMEANKIRLSFSTPEPNQRLPIEEWLKVLSIIELFSGSKDTGIFIDVATLKGQILFKEKIQSQFNNGEGLEHLKNGLTALKQVLHLAQMPQDFEMSANEIINQTAKFSGIEKIMNDRKAQASLTVELLDDAKVSGKSVGVFYYSDFQMGDRRVFLATSSVGPLKESLVNVNGKTLLTLAPIETEIHTLISLKSSELSEYKFREVLERISKKFQDLDTTIIIG